MKTRWTILTLCCIVMYGTYYLLFMPAPVHHQLEEVMPPNGFETYFQLQFTSTQAPGMILPFFTGAFVDVFGGRMCILFLSTIALTGQVLSSHGVETRSWPLLLAGRFIFGLAMESLFTSNQTFLTGWFEGKQLGLALGMSCAASYTGLLFSQALGPIFSNEKNAAFSYWAGAMFMAASVISAVIIFIIDKKCPQRVTVRNRSGHSRLVSLDSTFRIEDVAFDRNQPSEGTSDIDRTTNNISTRNQNFQMFRKTNSSYWLLCCLCLLAYSISRGFVGIASGFMLERNLFKSPSNDCVLQYSNDCSSGYLRPNGGNEAYDLDGKPCSYSIDYAPVIPLSLNITESQSSWQQSKYVFEDLKAGDIDCTDLFWAEACTSNYCSRQDDATMRAGLYMSIPFLVTVVTSHLLGHFMVDQMGWRIEMLSVASILLIVEHSLFVFTKSMLILPLIIEGFAHSLMVSSIWPSVPLTVEEDVVGRAFGLTTCIQGIGLTLFPFVISVIYTRSGENYNAVEFFFIASSVMYFLLSIALKYVDKRSGGILSAVFEGDGMHCQHIRCCLVGACLISKKSSENIEDTKVDDPC